MKNKIKQYILDQQFYPGFLGLFINPFYTSRRELILARASTTDLNNMARKQGMKLLFDDGFEKVKSGMTTIEELTRVAAPPGLLTNFTKRK
jgi:hypothetical protein